MIRASLIGLACTAALGVCFQPAQAAQASTSKGQPQFGAFGLDLSTHDKSVKPGDDFYRYADGHWLDTNTIPADRSSWGVFAELDERARADLRQLVEAIPADVPQGSAQQKVRDFYRSFVDTDAIERAGLTPAQPGLQAIAAAHTYEDLSRLMGTPELNLAAPFSLYISTDPKDPDRYIAFLTQSGLAMPDRDYYLKDDPKLKDIREKYVAYIGQILTLGGLTDTAAKAAGIMAFETEVAKVQWPVEKRRDVDATYNPRTKQQLLAYAPGFPWQTFLDSSSVGSRQDLVLSELTAIHDLADLFKRTSLPTLKSWLTFHYLSDHASYLPKRFDDARFAFYGQTLRGQPQQRERWKRAVDQVDSALGEQVGQLYVARYFPPESKAKMQELVANLRASLSDRIDALDWMTPETKSRAHEKLATFTPKIGYPEEWKDYSTLRIHRDDLLGNVRRAAEWRWQYQVARLDKPVDRQEWQMTPQTINAYYNPLNNEIVFPAAILQPPFFDPNADPAVNYGGIGAVIGHEIGHGFDDQGRKFGPTGALKDWWTQKDAEVFNTRVQRLINQYSSFEALPGLKVNGANTIGENIGDLGGLNMAYHAYHLSLKGKQAPVIDGLTGDQRFFLSWAQVWRAKYRDGALREQVMSDPHSPAIFRVNGPLPNIDAWYSAFDVHPGDRLYIKPEDRVSIW